MLQTLSYIINVAPEGVPQVVRLSQNENGRTLAFTLTGAGTVSIPAGATVTISGTKPDGVVYSQTGTISGTTASFPETTQMTAVSGIWPAKIKVTYGGETIATCKVVMAIDPDPVAPGSVPSSSQLNGLVAEAQQYATYAKYEAFGSPLVAATAAAMTDQTRVYVYTGSEAGKTAGHWYYWNGSAWTDGGVYNSQGINTDTTLTISGMAADAKATGDQFTLVKEDNSKNSESIYFLESLALNLIDTGSLALGSINSNGGDVASTTRRRTGWLTVVSGEEYEISLPQTWGCIVSDSVGNVVNNWKNKAAFTPRTANLRVAVKHVVNETDQDLTNVSADGIINLWKIDDQTNLQDEIDNLQSTTASLADDIDGLAIEDNSIFAEIPNTKIRGIVGITLIETTVYNITQYQKYRISGFYYRSGIFYLYINLQGYNGSAWVTIDSVDIRTASTPSTENPVMTFDSVYGAFKATIVPGLLSAYGNNNLNAELKNSVINFGDYENRLNIKSLFSNIEKPDFAFKDTIPGGTTNVVVVDKNGNGDYTTIGAAYASITDSSFINQYKIVILPGTYTENNLVPPKFTHTTGLHPDTVTVTGVGLTGANTSIFNLDNTCKLSNMTIVANASLTGGSSEANQNRYCIHFDGGISQRYAICENLKVIKVYDASVSSPDGVSVRNRGYNNAWSKYVVGMGATGHTNKIVFRNCSFVNGILYSHTQPNDTQWTTASIVIEGCQFVNSYVELATLTEYNTDGRYLCDINNSIFEAANNAKNCKLVYQEENHAWIVSGSNNKNLTFDFAPNDSSTDEAWECVKTTDKGEIYLASDVSVSKGKWIDITGNIANNPILGMVFGCALESKTANAVTPVKVWTGNAFPYTASDGEYGITSGDLSASASNKVGFVKNNIFYRY